MNGWTGRRLTLLSWSRLHEFDRRAVRIAYIDDAPPEVGAAGQGVGRARRFPTRSGDSFEDDIEIIDREGDMNRANIARSPSHVLPIGRRMILEQFDLVSGRFQNGEGQLRARNSSHVARQTAGMMRAVRKFEAEHIAPEGERAFEIPDGNPGVIGGKNLKRSRAHALP